MSLCLSACSHEPPLIVSEPIDIGSAQRGQQLVNGLAACGFCHSEQARPLSPLQGGRLTYDSYGPLRAPNITPSETGISGWKATDILRVLRESRDKNDQRISSEVHYGFNWMSDDDALAISAYLRTLDPIDNQVERRPLSFIDRNTTGILESQSEVRGSIPAISPRYEAQYGRYLVDHVARCSGCHHSPGSLFVAEGYLTGGNAVRFEDDEKVAPDITSSQVYGIGDWSEQALLHYLQSGQAPDGKEIDPNFCPTAFFARAPESDLRAIVKYIKSIESGV